MTPCDTPSLAGEGQCQPSVTEQTFWYLDATGCLVRGTKTVTQTCSPTTVVTVYTDADGATLDPAPQIVMVSYVVTPCADGSGPAAPPVDREIVTACNALGELVAVQFDVTTNPPTELSRTNITTGAAEPPGPLVACDSGGETCPCPDVVPCEQVSPPAQFIADDGFSVGLGWTSIFPDNTGVQWDGVGDTPSQVQWAGIPATDLTNVVWSIGIANGGVPPGVNLQAEVLVNAVSLGVLPITIGGSYNYPVGSVSAGDTVQYIITTLTASESLQVFSSWTSQSIVLTNSTSVQLDACTKDFIVEQIDRIVNAPETPCFKVAQHGVIEYTDGSSTFLNGFTTFKFEVLSGQVSVQIGASPALTYPIVGDYLNQITGDHIDGCCCPICGVIVITPLAAGAKIWYSGTKTMPECILM